MPSNVFQDFEGIWMLRSLILIFSFLTPISCSSLEKYRMAPAFETVIFDKTNELRASLNLPPLKMVHDLNTKAKAWSKAQAHGACGRFRKLCHKYPIENVAWTSRSSLTPSEAEAVLFEMWKKSPGHYQNLISPNSKIGIGIHKTSKGYWATQIFQK